MRVKYIIFSLFNVIRGAFSFLTLKNKRLKTNLASNM